MINIVVSGALGRMGGRIIELAKSDSELKVSGMVEKVSHPQLGIAGKIEDIKDDFDCIIEFTTPEATAEHVKVAEKLGKAMVIGTTALSGSQMDIIKNASGRIPIVYSPNMSIAVNLLFSFIEKATDILGRGYHISIKETHHVHKKDAPSGTAKFMAEIVKNISGKAEIPISSIRENEVVGDHEITFESNVDVVRISHSAKTRDIFAYGALRATKFVVKKENGLFSMKDVLSLG